MTQGHQHCRSLSSFSTAFFASWIKPFLLLWYLYTWHRTRQEDAIKSNLLCGLYLFQHLTPSAPPTVLSDWQSEKISKQCLCSQTGMFDCAGLREPFSALNFWIDCASGFDRQEKCSRVHSIYLCN